ncbi:MULTISPECIES: peptidoglycan-binding domain-containing protein [unclassified Clostridioides]|uniref:peptidoglycan-binding domain-containing protein n=1 Tax=unclassified Clostridioides TaxID=2635829 RepID=UPI001D113CFE
MKRITKILVITSCLTLAFSNTVFANVDNKNSNYVNVSNKKSDEKSFTVSGYEFTYQNAPEEVKKGYEKSCEEFNIKPSPDNIIFVPDDNISTYDLDEYIDARTWFDVSYSKSGGYFKVVGGNKNYTVSTSVTVGYGYVTSGNPVHLVQILCRNLAGVNIEPDSQFGNNTYNAVKTLQGKLGLTRDGIVGKQTWEAAGNRIP